MGDAKDKSKSNRFWSLYFSFFFQLNNMNMDLNNHFEREIILPSKARIIAMWLTISGVNISKFNFFKKKKKRESGWVLIIIDRNFIAN